MSITNSLRSSRTDLLIGVAGVIVVGLVAAATVKSAFIGVGVSAAIILFLVTYRRPRVALVLWMVTLAFVPPWVGVHQFGFIPAASAMAALVIVTHIGSPGWRLTKPDLIIIGLIVFCGLGVIWGTSQQGVWLSMITQWGASYLAAKLLARSIPRQTIGTVFVVVMTIVAGCSLIEFALNWHPFTGLAFSNDMYTIWSPIQLRGNLSRSEWAFGHSIALGGALSAAVPFLLMGRYKAVWKALSLALLIGGVVVTFSRAGLIDAGIGILFCIFLGTVLKPGQKIALTVLLCAAAVVALPTLGTVFTSSEATNSSQYRAQLLTLIPTLRPIGRSSAAVVGGDGSVTYGSFGSIDNALLALGLGFGWIPAGIALTALIVIIVRAFRLGRSPADVALAAAIPLFLTVAMITQWQSLVWALAGFAAIRTSEDSSPEVSFEHVDSHRIRNATQRRDGAPVR